MSNTGFLWSDRYTLHDTSPGHPERSVRLSGIRDRLARSGLFESTVLIEPAPVQPGHVERVHTPVYIERFRQRCERGLSYIDTQECPLSPVTFEIAGLAVGGVLRACDEIMSGRLQSAFCAVRPPGHHAESNRAMGFCYFNNVAIAAEYLRHHHGLKRLAILDFDVHHGNGTQHHFEADPEVLFCSIHQDPMTLFPGTGFDEEVGTGAGAGTTVNCSMPAGSTDGDYRRAFDERILPRISEFHPEFLLMSAGFDAHTLDPLAQIDLSTEAFGWMTADVARIMHGQGHPRILSVLEGGYHIEALADSIQAHLEAFLSMPPG